jgi:Flp pilus assembly pilin Flp
MAFSLTQLRTWLVTPFAGRDRDRERGSSLVEYALLVALIAIVCLVAVNTIGGPTSEGLSNGAAGFP